jgi:hypothetical protein
MAEYVVQGKYKLTSTFSKLLGKTVDLLEPIAVGISSDLTKSVCDTDNSRLHAQAHRGV